VKKVVLSLLVFVINLQSLCAQQWVWDEMSKEEREPITFGGIVLFVIVVFVGYLIYKIVSSNKTKNKPESFSTSNDNSITSSRILQSSSSKNMSPDLPIEKDGFTLSYDGTKLIKACDSKMCVIPNGVKIICSDAFKKSKNIKTVIIPNTVEEIEDFAFSSLHIEDVSVPKSIIKWGKSVFYMCEELKDVHFEEGLTRLGKDMFMTCDSLESIVIPESIKGLPDNIFYSCKSLKQIKLPSQLTYIGENAFCQCEQLESIELPTTLIGLCDDTFSDCYKLSSIVVPEGVTVISSRCFARCDELKTIRIPSTLQHIDADAFEDCSNIVIEVPIGESLRYWELKIDNVSMIVEYETSTMHNLEELKKKSESFIEAQNIRRKRNNLEFRAEMGLLTKEEYERENACYLDMLSNSDDWDDL